MSLSTLTFMAIYFPILLVIYYNPLFKSVKFKNIILLLASIGLYGFAEPIYVFLLLISILFNFSFVKIEDRTSKKLWGNIAIVVDILLLFFFKYINQLLCSHIVEESIAVKIAFPIGLSYFTFREISYIVECRKKQKYCQVGFVNSALFISNFITITAGPLGFWNEEVNSISERSVNKDNIYAGIYRYVIGLIKKIIIADSLKNLVDACFVQGESSLSLVMAWVGAIAYTLQIFFDFSGYSDMAIGIGKVFGIELIENFDMPYTATSIEDFWKRWHISLTKWFTRYIYIPLGGSRVDSKHKHILNLFVVWLCTGIWHGSNWTFIVWGLIYFVFQVLEKYTDIVKKIRKFHLEHVYTMLVVILCWVIFRADSLFLAGLYIGSMFGLNSTGIISSDEAKMIANYLIPLTVGVLFSSSFAGKVRGFADRNKAINVLNYFMVFMLFMVSIILMIGRGYTAPLYAGF